MAMAASRGRVEPFRLTWQSIQDRAALASSARAMQASIDHPRPVLDWHGVRTPREPATLEAFAGGPPGRAADMGDISPT